MNLRCHACGAAVEAVERIGRRDACPGCGEDLHCCRNCRFHDAGAYNECREPQAERQVDKQRANFCAYFEPTNAAAAAAGPSGAARSALDSLFAGRGK